jgi:hypothetical protein
MRRDEIRGIEAVLLSDILRSESIQIPSEDWLFDFVLELGGLHSILLSYVRFESLSPSSIDVFFTRVSTDSIDDLLWHQLWNRCPEFVQQSPDSAWSGLIPHLTELCGGNGPAKGFVAVSCSSAAYGQCWNTVNYDGNHYCSTHNSPNSWIQFDFKD